MSWTRICRIADLPILGARVIERAPQAGVAPDHGCAQRFPVRIEAGVVFLDLAPANAANQAARETVETVASRAVANG